MTRTSLDSPLYLIWSNEHAAWWAPSCAGYTYFIEHAGFYSEEKANDICLNANRYIEAGSPFNEIKIPVTDEILAARERIKR